MTSDKKLAEWVGKEARAKRWPAVVAAEFPEFLQGWTEFNPDVLLVDADDGRILDWMKMRKFSGRPLIFVKKAADDVLACFQRLERLVGQMHFPRLDLHIDSERQMAHRGKRRLNLTTTELRLLRELAGVELEAVAREALEQILCSRGGGRKRVLDVHICALRKKLGAVGLIIESVRGVGYRLNPC